MQRYAMSLATAILLAGTSAAYPVLAQNPGNIQTPSSGGAVKNAPGGHDSLSNVDSGLGQWAVGQTVYNREGNAVGVVKGMHRSGSAVVVSVSQYGGIGPNDIVLDKKHLNQSGSGADMRLITNLSEAELRSQPTVDTYEKVR